MACDLTTNLVFHLKFSNDLLDETANNNDFTNSGSTSTSDKNSTANQARSFDGSNDYIYRDMSAWFNTFDTVDKSWSYWIQADTKSVADCMCYVRGASSTPQIDFGSWNTGSVVRFKVMDNSGTEVSVNSTTSPATDGTWYHIVGTWDASADTLKIFVNGTEEDSATNASVGTISTFDSTDTMTIGGRNSHGTIAFHFDGKMDEWRGYDRIIDQDTIDELYSGYDAPSCSTGYANKVNGVTAASISKVNGVATASISKVNGI